jgi:hypothetical protein
LDDSARFDILTKPRLATQAQADGRRQALRNRSWSGAKSATREQLLKPVLAVTLLQFPERSLADQLWWHFLATCHSQRQRGQRPACRTTAMQARGSPACRPQGGLTALDIVSVALRCKAPGPVPACVCSRPGTCLTRAKVLARTRRCRPGSARPDGRCMRTKNPLAECNFISIQLK